MKPKTSAYEDLESAGAAARTAGKDWSANPYLEPNSSRPAGGQEAAEWLAKQEAWQLGWMRQDTRMQRDIANRPKPR